MYTHLEVLFLEWVSAEIPKVICDSGFTMGPEDTCVFIVVISSSMQWTFGDSIVFSFLAEKVSWNCLDMFKKTVKQ